MNKKKIILSILGIIVVGYISAFVYNIIKTVHYSRDYEVSSSRDMESFNNLTDIFTKWINMDGDVLGFKYSELKKGELTASYRVQDTNVYILQLPVDIQQVRLSKGENQKRAGHYKGLFEMTGCKAYYQLNEEPLKDQEKWDLYTDSEIKKIENNYYLNSLSYLSLVNENKQMILSIECREKQSLELRLYPEAKYFLLNIQQVQ